MSLREPDADGGPMAEPAQEADYLYIWMRRDRPRRKGDTPGAWKPFPFAEPTADPRHLRTCVEIRAGDRKEEHAVFRVRLSALQQVYPPPTCDLMAIAKHLRAGRAASKYARNLTAAARAAGVHPSRLHMMERASVQGEPAEYARLCQLYVISPGPMVPGQIGGDAPKIPTEET